MTFKVNKKFIYVSYEGTDHLLSGWKEDFELAYKFPIESQKYAIEYLNKTIGFFDKNIVIGGHSKGGNLALVASMYAKKSIKKKIIKIYSNDGPGLRKKEIESKEYKSIEEKYIHIIPNYSVVGLLLRHTSNYKVIKSTRKDLMAHSIMTWQINNTELDLDEDGIPKLEYIQVGEFLLPNLSLEKVDGYIGRWGIMRKEYLQKHKPAVYSSMLLMDELNQHLIDIQKTADERMDVLEKQLLERDPAPDKAKDGMAWTRHMNQIRHQAEEYVKSEIIFN